VGGLNNIGQRLQPKVIILRIGEWPGLGRAASRRASMASPPHAGHTDADHRMVSHLCANGNTDPRAGAACILALS
jgi:ethanolamine ammonia-lyase small subunit